MIDTAAHSGGAHAAEIAAVASDTFWHNVVGVDRDGNAVTPLYTWADTRSERAAVALARSGSMSATSMQRTGCMIHPMYLPAKLLWLSEARAGR